MAVLLDAIYLKRLWAHPEKSGRIILYRSRERNDRKKTLTHHQGIICGVAFDRSSLRRIALYASVVASRRPRY